jgi:CHASE2 domain-containing sensor protein
MAIKVEHEIHGRRKGRNFGVGLLLAAFIALVFALTVVKVLQLGEARQFEKFDHVARPAIIPQEKGVVE